MPWAARILKPSDEGASHLTHGARSLKLWERSTRVANFNVYRSLLMAPGFSLPTQPSSSGPLALF